MIKTIVAALALFSLLCVNRLELEQAAADWATRPGRQMPFGLIHVKCSSPILGHAACTFYYQNWSPMSGTCNRLGCIGVKS